MGKKPRNDLFVNFDVGAYRKPVYLASTPFEFNVGLFDSCDSAEVVKRKCLPLDIGLSASTTRGLAGWNKLVSDFCGC